MLIASNCCPHLLISTLTLTSQMLSCPLALAHVGCQQMLSSSAHKYLVMMLASLLALYTKMVT